MHAVTRIALPMIGALLLFGANPTLADPSSCPVINGALSCGGGGGGNYGGPTFGDLLNALAKPFQDIAKYNDLDNRASAAFDAGDYADAAILYRAALRLRPGDEYTLHNLMASLDGEGLQAARNGDFDAAINFYQQALQASDDPIVRANLQAALDHNAPQAPVTAISNDDPPVSGGDSGNTGGPAGRTGGLAGRMFASAMNQAGPITAPAPTQQAAFGDMSDLRDAVAAKPAASQGDDVEAGTITPSGSDAGDRSGGATGNGMGGSKSAPVGSDFVKDKRIATDPNVVGNTHPMPELGTLATLGTSDPGAGIDSATKENPGAVPFSSKPKEKATFDKPLTSQQQALLDSDKDYQRLVRTRDKEAAKQKADSGKADALMDAYKKSIQDNSDQKTQDAILHQYIAAHQLAEKEAGDVKIADNAASERKKAVTEGAPEDANGNPLPPAPKKRGLDDANVPPPPKSP